MKRDGNGNLGQTIEANEVVVGIYITLLLEK